MLKLALKTSILEKLTPKIFGIGFAKPVVVSQFEHEFWHRFSKNKCPFSYKKGGFARGKKQRKRNAHNLKRAQVETEGKTAEAKKPVVFKYDLNHVTYLIEHNKSQLVIIARNVDPIELFVWLPSLCKKMEIPYCIVKGKSHISSKTASILCLTKVKNEDRLEILSFNNKYDEYKKKWGGGIMGSKSEAKTRAKERVLAKEAAQRIT
ncbi:hypothetical protein UlMin_027523 [Ulmus minor]